MEYKYNRIMILDDEEIDSYLLSIILKENNIAKEIIQFNDGHQALEYLNKNKSDTDKLPELIFVDLYMPNLDGFNFINYIDELNISDEQKCRIWVLSGSISDTDIYKSTRSKRVIKYSSKPITLEMISSI